VAHFGRTGTSFAMTANRAVTIIAKAQSPAYLSAYATNAKLTLS
jgi:hypothetical protein